MLGGALQGGLGAWKQLHLNQEETWNRRTCSQRGSESDRNGASGEPMRQATSLNSPRPGDTIEQVRENGRAPRLWGAICCRKICRPFGVPEPLQGEVYLPPTPLRLGPLAAKVRIQVANSHSIDKMGSKFPLNQKILRRGVLANFRPFLVILKNHDPFCLNGLKC